jgi:hypothetical protein
LGSGGNRASISFNAELLRRLRGRSLISETWRAEHRCRSALEGRADTSRGQSRLCREPPPDRDAIPTSPGWGGRRKSGSSVLPPFQGSELTRSQPRAAPLRGLPGAIVFGPRWGPAASVSSFRGARAAAAPQFIDMRNCGPCGNCEMHAKSADISCVLCISWFEVSEEDARKKRGGHRRYSPRSVLFPCVLCAFPLRPLR